MLDHISIYVTDLDASKEFYLAALKPLGYTVHNVYDGVVGLGVDRKADFWLAKGDVPSSKLHLAFTTTKRSVVDAFYAAALEAGGKDNGPPGARLIYSPTYYGAFVYDLHENNLEVVCHTAEDVADVADVADGENKHDSEENPAKKRKADGVVVE